MKPVASGSSEEADMLEQHDESNEQTFGDSVNSVRMPSIPSHRSMPTILCSFSPTAISVALHQRTIAMT